MEQGSHRQPIINSFIQEIHNRHGMSKKQNIPSNETDKSSNDLVLALSARELWFLLQQFSPAVIFGMENPYLGWLADEIRADQRKVLKSIIDRDLVRKVSKDEIELDDVMAHMIEVCAHPEHTLIIQFQNCNHENMQRYIHFWNSLTVEQFEFKPGQHSLTAIKDREALIIHLNDSLRLSTTITGHGGKFRLAEDAMFEARSLCSDGHKRKALNNLTKAGLSEGKAAMLTTALSKPVANYAFAVLSNRNNPDAQHVKGFAVLESDNGLWIMLPHDKNGEKMVEFVPADAKSVKDYFLNILP